SQQSVDATGGPQISDEVAVASRAGGKIKRMAQFDAFSPCPPHHAYGGVASTFVATEYGDLTITIQVRHGARVYLLHFDASKLQLQGGQQRVADARIKCADNIANFFIGTHIPGLP
ncbi:MAG: hypothetical protein ACK559_24405, partial [bacterium]